MKWMSTKKQQTTIEMIRNQTKFRLELKLVQINSDTVKTSSPWKNAQSHSANVKVFIALI